MNICEHLTSTARIFPERIAISFEGLEYSYSQLDQLSAAAAEQLLSTEVQTGDRIALMLPNVPAFAVWYYAILRIGAIAVSVSTRAAVSEVAFITEDCEAKVLIADEATLSELNEKLPACVKATFRVPEKLDDVSGTMEIDSPVHSADPNDAALILYTSGTTGFPKGATLSHMNVRSNVCAFNHLCKMQPKDRLLLAVPLFHCFGQNALLNSAFNVGATLVLQRRFDLNEAKRLIADQQITQLYGVPMMFQLLNDSCEPSDLASVNYCFSAAAPLPIQVSKRWQQKFSLPINEGYGLTETSPFASYNHRIHFEPGSIGTPIDCVEMKIIDTETGQECDVGELGEIAVRGPNVMLGYWNRPDDTAAAVQDGWFHSGDIGRVDSRGYYFIVDRVKDMISVGGLKVFPAEVERVLLDNDAVAQAAVVGIPDDVFGEQVVAFVATQQELTDVELQQIQQHCRNQLANYKVPRLIVRIDELPRNPSGKVLKTQLREYDFSTLAKPLSQDTADAQSAASTQNQLRKPTLRKSLINAYPAGRQQVAMNFVQHLVQVVSDSDDLPDAETRFLDAGLDSLMIVEMSNQIQVELGSDFDVPATLVFDHPRICDLSEYLLNALVPNQEDKTKLLPTTVAVDKESTQQVAAMSEEEALAELMKELES